MKLNLFFQILCFIFIGCSEDYPAKITKLGILIFENDNGEKIISIQDHPLDSFNGKYIEQSIKINDASYFQNENKRYLYFYDQAEGGAKGWSLDHRKPDGIKDHFSGGWFYLEKFQELNESCVDWQAVDQGIFYIIPNGSISELQEWINDGANPKVVMDYYGLSLIDYAKELERDDIIEYLKSIED
tara:strand:- start:131 stop:688 length:558 start_codon:yes stop_codon:yes gene_type:complete